MLLEIGTALLGLGRVSLGLGTAPLDFKPCTSFIRGTVLGPFVINITKMSILIYVYLQLIVGLLYRMINSTKDPTGLQQAI